MNDDYCELCDLPKSTCIHGRPPPAPQPVVKAAPKPRRTTTTRTSRTPGTRRKPVSRRWTPPDELKVHIVTVLRAAGGEMERDRALAELEVLVGDLLREGDRETTPEGELRWHFAARRARQALITEGVMTKGSPGMWTLA